MTYISSLFRNRLFLVLTLILVIGVVFGVYLGTSLSWSRSNNTPNSNVTSVGQNISGNFSWSLLFGANYAWGPLGIQCCANPPATDFPIMHSLGFNLIRVPLSWNVYEQNPSAYMGYLNQVANEADALGMHILYDAHTSGSNAEPGFFFPSSLSSQYGNGSSFFYAWWTQQVSYNGQPGWNAVWNDFWTPVIQTVNSHPSTMGYEIENEPHPDGANLSDLQAYNQFIANHMQAITNKYVVFMGPYVSLDTLSDGLVAPTGITNLVMDVHCYIGTSTQPDACAQNGGIKQNLASVSNLEKSLGIHILIGEWAVCNPGGCTVTQSQASSIIQQYVTQFRQYGFANTYWVWKCDTDSATVGQTDLLTAYPGCNTYWLDTELSQAKA